MAEEVSAGVAESDYLFIQPWLDRNEDWAGLQVSYAGRPEKLGEELRRLLALASTQAIDRRLPWFMPLLDPSAIAPATADANSVCVFQPGAATGQPEDWEAMERELRLAGRKLGVVVSANASLPAGGTWDYVFLSASRARTLPPFHLVGLGTRSTVALTGLHSRNEFMWAHTNQCSLFSTEYLLNRSPTNGNAPDMTRLRLLKLLALIVEDADTREMEEVFRQEPKLAYGLLRLVNSAAMAPRSPIASFSQAIAILGRKQLQRWLQLLVYAAPGEDQHPNPLLLLAAERGRLVELLAARLEGQPSWALPPDMPFMIGTFSLLDVLLNLPMPDILLQLPVPAEVHAALEEHRGPYGQLLTALGAADSRDYAAAACSLASLGIDGETFTSAQMEALLWASSIRNLA